MSHRVSRAICRLLAAVSAAGWLNSMLMIGLGYAIASPGLILVFVGRWLAKSFDGDFRFAADELRERR